MLYESDIRCATKDKEYRDAFFKLMEMYLKSKSLHSYLIEKDLNGISIIPTWRDPFVWWYIRKERFLTFFLAVMLSCTLCATITYLLCSYIVLSIGINILIAAFHIGIINIFKDIMKHLGKTDVPSSISGLGRCASFEVVDDVMTEQELERLS